MLLYEKGIITDKDTDGIPMERGSREALIQTIHKTAKREGFGDILADGPTKFAKKIGPEAQKLHMQRGGYAGLRTVDMRVVPGWALGEAIAARANSHRSTPRLSINTKTQTPEIVKKAKDYGEKAYGSKNALIPEEYEGKAALVIEGQIDHAFIDSLGLCLLGARDMGELLKGVKFSPYSPDPVELGLFYAATGLTWNTKDVIEFANRVINVERAFNVRDGLTRKDDTVAERFFTEPVADGHSKGKVLNKTKFEKMKNEYYQLRGWDIETGWPTRQTLMSLGLKDVADDLNKYHKLPKPKPKTD
jgi:aldehyde:ferredoxin oxidoreductase